MARLLACAWQQVAVPAHEAAVAREEEMFLQVAADRDTHLSAQRSLRSHLWSLALVPHGTAYTTPFLLVLHFS